MTLALQDDPVADPPLAVLLARLAVAGPVDETLAALVDDAVTLWSRPGFDTLASVPRLRFTPFPHQLQAAQSALRRMRGQWRHYPYTLRWEGRQGRPGEVRVAEVVSGRGAPGARLSGQLVRNWWRGPTQARPLPAARVALDPVAAALWRVELPGRGPYLLLRCLAAWWRAEEQVDTAALGEEATAAALARLVAACAGTQLSYDAVATQYAADPAAVRAVGGRLRPLLALSDARGW